MKRRVTSRDNKALIRQLHEKGYPGGPNAIDRFFAASYVDHSGWSDREGLKTTLRSFLSAYPNTVWKVEDMVAEGDKVAVRVTIEIKTAAGTARTIRSTSIYRIAGGKVAEQWSHGDPLF